VNLSIIRSFFIGAFVVAIQTLHAGSATWNLNPTSNDWNTAANWTPATIPSSETDVATFAVSNTTDIVCGDAPGGGGTSTIVGGIVFAAGASSYTITITPVFDNIYDSILEIYGTGITNNSGVAQNLVAADSGTVKESARIYFNNSSSAGENVMITNLGAAYDNTSGGFTQFLDSSTAGNATFINSGGTASGAGGGSTSLLDYTSAESASFISNPGAVSGSFAGYTFMQTLGDLGTATFIGNPAVVPGAEGGWVEIDYGITSGTNFIANGATLADCQAGQIYVYGGAYGTGTGVATFTGNGGDGNGAEGGLIDLFALPRSDQTIVIANAGTNGGFGGNIVIEGNPVLDLGQFQVFGNGLLDLTNVTSGGITIGSLAGSGSVSLAGHSLTVGNNNLNTTFSGIIQESGALIKTGAGTLTLSGANTYTGPTTVSAGVLIASNRTGSATGTGSVKVNAGTIGGKGMIAGTVTIGKGNGTGAVLAASIGWNQPATLALRKTLTLRADSTYSYKLNTNNARADQVIAKGVTIEAGAQFSFQAVANRILTIGTVFTAINNTSANAITGTFVNLPDNSTFTAGRNNYQVSYEGGTGNDLTLTVVP
jgi:fibronectin-binding autotransporter adhesin